MMETIRVFREDLAYASRSLRKAPAFTAAAVLTLALGIGATSAIFSVVDAVLLRPLPLPDADRVVHLAWEGNGHLQQLSAVKFQYWKDHARSFAAMATWRPSRERLDVEGDVSAVGVIAAGRDLLAAMGMSPAIGRDFVAGEWIDGGPRVGIISHAIWQAQFHGAADVVGRALRLNDERVTVVGVLPASFAFPYEEEPVAAIVPLRWTVNPDDVAEDWPAIARLRAGATRGGAEAEVTALNEPFRAAYPKQVGGQGRGMAVVTFSELYVDGRVRRALWILMGAVTLVLLIACANAANLFLVRATRRRAEIAVRSALGASGGRIARLVLTEGILVALLSGALGLLLGGWSAALLIALTPADVPRMTTAGIDGRVMLFTLVVSLATSLIFGGAAAWPAARARISDVLKETPRGSSGRARVRQSFLAVQSGLAMVLLVGAGLLVATWIGLMRVDLGFAAEGVVAMRVPSRPAGYATPQDLSEFERRVMQQLEGSPAIRAIAGASSLPLERGINTPMSIAGRPELAGTVEWRAVTERYFATLGIALVAGREIQATDAAGGPPVAVVNESFARRYFPDRSAIGQRIEVGRIRDFVADPSTAGAGVEIVGVVGDIREVSPRAEPRRTMYVPQAQASPRLSNLQRTLPVFVARGGLPAPDVARALTAAIRAVDAGLPRPEIFPVGTLVTRSLAAERFGATLVSSLAALALSLTAFGIYAVLAYTIQQRRREIGIRLALGASGRQVVRVVMMQGMAPVVAGLVLGLLGALSLARIAAGFLWGVTATDMTTVAATMAILIAVTLVASWIPARGAAALDPLRALHDQ